GMAGPAGNPMYRPYDSVVPDAIDGLVAACTAAFAAQALAGGEKVYVRDGPWIAGESGGAWAQDVAIGWFGFIPGYQYPTRALADALGEPVVDGRNETSGLAPSQEESFLIGCASIVQYGGEPEHPIYSALRRRAYGNVTAVARAISDKDGLAQYLTAGVE